MQRVAICSLVALACLLPGACDVPRDDAAGEVELRSGLAFPEFPLYYRGSGRFREVGVPQHQLVATYEFDMEIGVNREVARYVDREVLIFNVFDLDPSDGVDPDREYFVSVDPETGDEGCALSPFPIPNVFSRDWWLSQGLVYQGPDTIEGWPAECWEGGSPGFPVRFCNRADVYPEFAPVLKKIGAFEFYDFYGEEAQANDHPKKFWKLPKSCQGL